MGYLLVTYCQSPMDLTHHLLCYDAAHSQAAGAVQVLPF